MPAGRRSLSNNDIACLFQSQFLNVNDTSLGNEGSVQVALAVADSPAGIEELEMSLNEITPQGAKAVAVAVASKAATLTKLQLRENELEDKGAVIVAKAIAKVR